MFAKGHGTQNDFVLLPDPDGRLSLTPAAVAALCDRRRGLGADGVLRVTRAEAALAAGVFDRLPEGVAAGDWYMDYRNADGSIAQMCGNGVRVFAHYLRASGLESRDEFVVGSLAGPRPVVLHRWDDTTADVTVEMGKTNQLGTGEAIVGGRPFAGLAIDVGNPHLACVDPDLTGDELAALDVAAPVSFDRTQFPDGRQHRGADRAAWWGGVDAGTRERCRRDPILWHRNRRRRRRGAGIRRCRPRARCGCAFPAARSRSPSPTPAATCAARRSWWRAARSVGGMVARCAALIRVHEPR